MKSKVVVHIHNSPFQILVALEYLFLKKIPLSEVVFLIFTDENSVSGKQIALTLKEEGVPNFRIFPIKNFLGKLLQCSELRGYSGAEQYLVSMAGVDLGLVIPSQSRKTKVVFFDEGTHSISVLSNESKEIVLHASNALFGLKKWLMGVRDIKVDEVFTSYFHTKVPSNKFERLRSKVSNLKKSNKVVFLGQHLYKDFRNSSSYVQLITELYNKYGDKLVYYSHRKDESSILDQLVAKGINIQRNLRPVETEILYSEELPEIILGCTTSALHSLDLIFKDVIEVKFIRIDRNTFKDSEWPHYQGIYDFYEKVGIKEYLY